MLVTERLQPLRRTVLDAQVLRETLDGRDRGRSGTFPFKPVRDAVVGEFCGVADRSGV
jgi:hypothetical protein